MTGPPKENAGRQPGAFQSGTDSPKPSNGRPEFQGNIGNARNRGQKSPTWHEPPESAAMRLLERLWGRT